MQISFFAFGFNFSSKLYKIGHNIRLTSTFISGSNQKLEGKSFSIKLDLDAGHIVGDDF